jgi:hypothetical protein
VRRIAHKRLSEVHPKNKRACPPYVLDGRTIGPSLANQQYRKNALTSYRNCAILKVGTKREAMMPETDTVFFADDDGTAPLLDWLDDQDRKAQDKCLVKIERLQELGYELRRPEADYLRDGIYELRVRHRSVNYRILYFFHDQEGQRGTGALIDEVRSLR